MVEVLGSVAGRKVVVAQFRWIAGPAHRAVVQRRPEEDQER